MPHPLAALPPSLVDLLLDAICLVDASGRFVYVSAAGERIFGYPPHELVGKAMIDLVHPDDRARTRLAAGQVMSGEPLPMFENRYLRPDGSVVYVMWSAKWSEADQLRIAVARDITKRKLAEFRQDAVYAISQAAFQADTLYDLLIRINRIIGEFLIAPRMTVALNDHTRDELHLAFHANESGPVLSHTDPEALAICQQVWTLRQTVHHIGESGCNWMAVLLHTSGGAMGVLALQGSHKPYSPADLELLQFIANQVAIDIERKQLQARLLHAAHHDELTSLPNRVLLFDRLRTALARAKRQSGRMALLFVDLDRFKDINDQHGHGVGDHVLQEVAARLKTNLRDADTVARMGGDEFVIVLEHVPQREHALAVADKLRRAICVPMAINGLALHITPSIGVAIYPDDGGDEQTLLARADSAMYRIKPPR